MKQWRYVCLHRHIHIYGKVSKKKCEKTNCQRITFCAFNAVMINENEEKLILKR